MVILAVGGGLVVLWVTLMVALAVQHRRLAACPSGGRRRKPLDIIKVSFATADRIRGWGRAMTSVQSRSSSIRRGWFGRSNAPDHLNGPRQSLS